MITEDIRDQIELCKKSIQKALGHMARVEQLSRALEAYIK